MTTLANNIRSLRKKLGYTQNALGTICGVSGASVSQWEAKESPTQPDIKYLLIMAKTFKVTVEQLVEKVDAKPEYSPNSEIDIKAMEMVFNLLHKSAGLDLVINKTAAKHKALLIGFLYSICNNEDVTQLEKNDIDILINMPLTDD